MRYRSPDPEAEKCVCSYVYACMYNDPKVNKFKTLDEITQVKSIAREESRALGSRILCDRMIYTGNPALLYAITISRFLILLDYIHKSHEKCLSENKVKVNW